MWVVTNVSEDLAACIFYPEDGGSRVFRNVCAYLFEYRTSQSRNIHILGTSFEILATIAAE
jgi:hypothetical protein